MNTHGPAPARNTAGRRSFRRRALLAGIATAAVLGVGALAFALVPSRSVQPTAQPLPLRQVGQVPLPGDSSRFDYASLDPERGLLFIAHLGASELVEVDVHAGRVIRTISNLAEVHGVLVVPALHRVYATATAANTMVSLDEDTGSVLATAPTGNYPDGLAFDSRRGAIWTTNESGGTETVIDANSGAVRGTVDLGGEVGNVVYDPVADQMLVAVQGRDDLAVIDPASLTIARRVPLPGCDHGHGLALDPGNRLGFIGCEDNSTLVSVDLTNGQVTGTHPVGDTPDVLAYDLSAHRLYVAAEDGTVSVLDCTDRGVTPIASRHLADGAHVVALDPTTHRSFYPIPHGDAGRPAVLEEEPTN
jgi:DNA-binding beta-propeller fold protein YncE